MYISHLLLCAAFTGFASVSQAQTAQPITSLPKPSSSTPQTPAAQQPASQPSAPADAVHPITSLPKPASEVTPAASQPAATVTAVPAAATVQPPAEAAPVAAPPAAVPAPVPESAPTVTPPAPSPVRAPVPVTPQLDAAPLHAALPPVAEQPRRSTAPPVRPFRTFGVQLKGGFAGFGVDVATPLARRLNARIGGSFFSYSGGYIIDGIHVGGEAKFRSGTVSLDIYPFNGSFRISPGVTVYNGNNLNASAMVPGGQQFDLGDGTYTSSTADPVTGSMSMTFGNRTAPSITMGWGNMIPRSGRHLSFPFEIGFQYIQNPMINIALHGTACDPSGNCGDIATDPTAQANLKQELDEINSDIRPLRFYPIISQGISWKF